MDEPLAYSRFIYFLLIRIERLFVFLSEKGVLHSIEKDIKKGNEPDDFKKAVTVTDVLIGKIKDRVGKTPIIAFATDDIQPYFAHLKKIFNKNNIEFVEDIPREIKQKQSAGIKVNLDNGHFNETGNKICGEILMNSIKRVKFLQNTMTRNGYSQGV